jgi:hypothetical protein
MQRMCVLFFIELGSRRVHVAGCTPNPGAPSVTQQPGKVAHQPHRVVGEVVDRPRSAVRAGGFEPIWTRQEQTAASDSTRLLTQEDPAPQTIFRVAVKKGSPVFVNMKLPYAASNRPK